MASYDPRKRTTQSDGAFLEAAGLDSRKKPRTVDSDPSSCEYIVGSVHDRFTLFVFLQVAAVHRMCAALPGQIKGTGGNFLSFRRLNTSRLSGRPFPNLMLLSSKELPLTNQ